MIRARVSWINNHENEAEISYTIYRAEDVPSPDYDEEGQVVGTSKKNLSVLGIGEVWLKMPYDQQILIDNLQDISNEYVSGGEEIEIQT